MLDDRFLPFALLLLTLTVSALLAACSGPQNPPPAPSPTGGAITTPPSGDIDKRMEKEEKAAELTGETDGAVTTPSGLQYVVILEGTGRQPEKGQNVAVHYTGWLTDGTKFDSSVDRGEVFVFPVGVGRVIPGWDEAVLSMREGEKRKLTIPADLAYGDKGAGAVIPPGATLVFEVELIEVR